MDACRGCGGALPADANFCPRCGIAQADRVAARDVRKTVTVLFSDVSGSTALGEVLDAERVRYAIDGYFHVARAAIERHGGTVEKFVGDAVMAVFGVPIAHDDDALRALRAARDIRADLVGLNAELSQARRVRLQARTGVNTGEVLVGDTSTLETFVTGDAVNVAARLQQAAPADAIVLGDATLRLVRGSAVVVPLEPLDIRTTGRRVAAYRLVSLEGGSRGATRVRPLIGRRRELRRLAQAHQDMVTEGRCELFTILGQPGVGKTRLVREFVRTLDGDSVVRGRCVEYGVGATYRAFSEIVGASVRIDDDERVDEARAALAQDVGGTADAVMRPIADGIGMEPRPSPSGDIAVAFRRFLEILAASRPLTVVIEDIHWAEPPVLDAIEHVLDASRGAAILMVCSARPELLERRSGWAGGRVNTTTVLLEPLPPNEAEQLIDAQPGGNALPTQLRQRILAAAEGNPLFVEETMAMLTDDGTLRADDEGWSFLGNPDAITLPPSIQALLAARLDTLAPDERLILARCAVVGRVFEGEAATVLAPDDVRLGLPELLAALVRKDVIRPDETAQTGHRFSFRHGLIRDAAYESLPKIERAAAHEQYASWLETTGTDRLGEDDATVGYHYEKAHSYRVDLGIHDVTTARLSERAATWLGRAGKRAVARQHTHAAADLFERAASLSSASSDRLRFRIAQADALLYAADYPAASAILDDVLRSSDLVDPVDRAEARMLRLWTRRDRAAGGTAAVRAEIASILWPVRHRRPARLRFEAWEIVGSVAQDNAEMVVADRAYARALEIAKGIGDGQLVTEAMIRLAGHGARSTTPVAEVRELCERILTTPGLALAHRSWTLPTLAIALAMEGDIDAARGRLAEAADLARESGFRVDNAETNAGLVALHAGDLEVAERQFRAARDSLQPGDDPYDLTWSEARIADVLCLLGRYDEALSFARSSWRGVPENAWADALGGAVQAHALACQRRVAESLSVAARIVARMRAGRLEQLPLVLGPSLEHIAGAYEAAGSPDEARAALRDAIALYAAKGVVTFRRRAEASLRALERPDPPPCTA
jgi:class 3 adenylate cyclase/tetratricopeptide (TPR) repeat protein